MEHVARPVVLVVDDTPDNITVLMEALKQDYAVLAATNGEKALKLAARESNPPDLILLDVMMPGMDGHEVLQKLKANEETSGIPVIFVTSLAESEEFLDMLWAHATEPRFAMCHRWKVGDVLMWNNLGVLHRRDPFDPKTRRVMHRSQIRGNERIA